MTIAALYELAHEFRVVAEQLEQLDLDEETVRDTLEGCAMEFDDKAVALASFIRNLETAAGAIREAEKAQATRRKAIENKVERLREYLMQNMTSVNRLKIECALFKIAVRDNPVSVVIEGEVPEDYMVQLPPPDPVPDKVAIKMALESGKEVPGARLQRGQRIEIK